MELIAPLHVILSKVACSPCIWVVDQVNKNYDKLLAKGEIIMKIKTTVLGLMLGSSLLFLSGCVSKVDEARIPPHSPKSGQNQLALLKPQKIRLESVKDYRVAPEGKRESLGIAMGDVVFVPPVVSVIEDVVVSEFKNAGHQFSDEGQTVTLSVKIRNFDAGTNSTPVYWDINGSTNIEVDVSGNKGESVSFSYVSLCSDRTYVWPSGELFKGVMLKCIDDFANKLRDDSALAEAIRNMTDDQ
jgi:uncharacterized lipoprotein YajG